MTNEGEIARRLMAYRPSASRGDFLMAVETGTGRVVSTTCLLRWQLSCHGSPVNAAMLEMVVTDPGYRRHGLVRAQIEAFHDRALAQGFDLCIIQGIPYYYRQFGYAYALDHTPLIQLDADAVAPSARSKELRTRAAAVTDAAALAALYDIEMSRQALHVRRNAEDWAYLLSRTGRAFEIIERQGTSAPVGYVHSWPAGQDLTIGEAGVRDPADAPALLALLAQRCSGSLSVCANRAHSLGRAAEGSGGKARIPLQWLVRIVDPCLFLRKIGLLLEARLSGAGLGAVDAEVVVNLFKSALRVRIVRGRIAAVERAGFIDASLGADGGDLCIPPDAFTRLALGYRDLDQVRDAWPDTTFRAGSRALIDALFPRIDSLILMPY